MKLDMIRTKPKKELRNGRGRKKDYTKFYRLLAMFNEKKEPLNLSDVKTFMGVTLATIRTYARDRGYIARVLKDDGRELYLEFEAMA
jgi:hypothetical protein